MNIFDYTRGITEGKNVEFDIKLHNTYMINLILSMNKDTIGFANIVNHFNSKFPDKLMFDFLFHSIPPKKRWSKYIKKVSVSKDVEDTAKHFGITLKQAEQYLKIYQNRK
jgi:hypothetical protein